MCIHQCMPHATFRLLTVSHFISRQCHITNGNPSPNPNSCRQAKLGARQRGCTTARASSGQRARPTPSMTLSTAPSPPSVPSPPKAHAPLPAPSARPSVKRGPCPSAPGAKCAWRTAMPAHGRLRHQQLGEVAQPTLAALAPTQGNAPTGRAQGQGRGTVSVGTNKRASKATMCVASGFCFLMLGSQVFLSTPELGHTAAASREYAAHAARVRKHWYTGAPCGHLDSTLARLRHWQQSDVQGCTLAAGPAGQYVGPSSPPSSSVSS